MSILLILPIKYPESKELKRHCGLELPTESLFVNDGLPRGSAARLLAGYSDCLRARRGFSPLTPVGIGDEYHGQNLLVDEECGSLDVLQGRVRPKHKKKPQVPRRSLLSRRYTPKKNPVFRRISRTWFHLVIPPKS